jgi:glycosyltransferase involved in cell wall biosynthesis
VSFPELIPGSWSRLLLPNLNIVGIPRIPFDILVHDLSFLVHPPWFSAKTRIWHRLARPKALIERAERVFAVSPQTERALIDLLGIPQERIIRIPLQIEPLIQRPSSRPLEGPYLFLLSGEDPRKNRACVERAFLELIKTHPHWTLVIAGMESPSNHPHIQHLPYLSAEERIRWMQHASLFVYPSWYEGFGLPLHEAQALGVPTIASSATTVASTAPPETLLLSPFAPGAWAKAFRDRAISV